MGNDKPVLVSVYCMTYNHVGYIRDALEGFVRQKTDFPFEVIVHDDASTDGTADIIREYEKKYPDIIRPIYQTENQYSKGINPYLAYIFPRLRGKYVAVCEGDDYWTDPEKLQRQVDVLEEHPSCAACVHQTRVHDCRNGREWDLSILAQDGPVAFADVLSKVNRIYHISSLMFRWAPEKELPAFMDKLGEVGDYPLSIFLALEGGIYYLNRTMSVYRWYSSPASWTCRVTTDPDKKREHWQAMLVMLRSLDDYTHGSYHELIDAEMVKYEYAIKRQLGDRAVYRDPKFERYWKSDSWYGRIRYRIKVWIPEKIRRKWQNSRSGKKG